MEFRKALIFLFAVLFLFTNISLALASNESPVLNGDKPVTNGKSVILMDASSSRILYEKNSHERLSPASLTKIMTALLVVENGNLNKEVKVSEYAAQTPECTVYLEPGETLSRKQLLYAAMLSSANDASVALAESVAGDESSFVKLMNQRAKQLGLKDTHFSNPHGLEAKGHYSSAYDFALLTRKALSIPTFAQIVGTPKKLIPWAGRDEDRVLLNMNRLLYRYDGAIGVKTGYTKEAGNCVVGAAQKGDMVLIAVSMNSPTVYDDLQQMLDYGFENFQMVSLGKIDEISASVKVIEGDMETVIVRPADNLMVASAPEEISKLSYNLVPLSQVEAPVKKGDVLGICKLYLNGKQFAEVDLLAAQAVGKKAPVTTLTAIRQWTSVNLNKWYFIVLLLFVALLVYKHKKKISFEDLLRQLLLRLLRRKIQRMQEMGKIKGPKNWN